MQLFEDDIRAIGGRMFDQLLPPRMQQLLWKHRDRIRSVQVFSQEPFIPWELIYLKDPDTGVVEPGNKFLGELGLLRWLYIGFPPDRLRIRRKRVQYLLGDYADPSQAAADRSGRRDAATDFFGQGDSADAEGSEGGG